MEELTLTKEQTVSELFALRAGLSKISDYTNEIVAEEKAISDRQANEVSARKAHEQTVQNVCNEEVAIETQTAEKIEQVRQDDALLGELGSLPDTVGLDEFAGYTLKGAIASIENAVEDEDVKKPLKSSRRLYFYFCFCVIVGNPFTIGIELIILIANRTKGWQRFGTLGETILGILLCVSIVCGISLLIMRNWKISAKIDNGASYRKDKNKYNKYVEECRVRDMKISKLKDWYEPAKAIKIAKCEKTIKEAKNKRDEALKAEESRFNCEIAELTEKNEKANEASREKIRVVSGKSASIDRAMTEQYPWISKSDWGNVDMIIYYIQTGRADTLKEALYQVDRQLQTDQIVNAVKESAAYVGRTINETLNRNFYVMSSIVRESTESIGAGLNSISRSARHILSSIDSLADKVEESAQGYARLAARQAALQGELLDAAQLNSALLEKSNSTSQELLNDLRYQQRYWVN